MKTFSSSTLPIVILSGPTRGLGKALFDQLLIQEFPIICVGRDLEKIAAAAKKAHNQIQLIEVDLAAEPSVLTGALVQLRHIELSNPTKPLVFINNASVIEPIGQVRSDNYGGVERAMRINYLSPIFIANLLSDITQTLDCSLHILNVSSGAASRPIRGWQSYCASKAACKMGLDVLAAENANVQVTHFDPGVMDTSMQQLIRDQPVTNMPDVATFRKYREDGLLKQPELVAVELIQLMKHICDH